MIHDLGGQRIAEYLYDDVAQTSALIREYVWMEDRAVAVIEGGVIYYIRTDHIGRAVFATDSNATIVWEATYLPFGGMYTSTGTPIDLRFPGQWFQAESGLHQNWMRDYDPTTGQYIQADPLGLVDGANVYGYALQSPLRYVDPTGEFVWFAPVVWGVFGGSGTGAFAGAGAGLAIALGVGVAVTPSTTGDGTMAPSEANSDAESEESACEPEIDCPLEMPVRKLTRIRDNDPRLAGLSPHQQKDSGSEDLYINRAGCVYVGPAKNSNPSSVHLA